MDTEEPMDTEPPMDTPSGSSTTVDMANTAYAPKVLEVDVGTTVEWTNEDSFPHDVVATQFNDGAASWDFDSGSISSGGSTSYTFDSEGVYEYFCSIHGEGTMCGVVLVGDASKAGDLPCSSGGDGGGYGDDY